jgi:hypothetical protein
MTMDMPEPTTAPHPSLQDEHTTIFINSYTTPLYSSRWTPASAGHYAATCIFLVILAIAGRGLVASKGLLEQRWKAAALSRQRTALAAKSTESEAFATSGLDTKMGTASTARRVDQDNERDTGVSINPAPFQPMVDVSRALIFTVITGVSFLL